MDMAIYGGMRMRPADFVQEITRSPEGVCSIRVPLERDGRTVYFKAGYRGYDPGAKADAADDALQEVAWQVRELARLGQWGELADSLHDE